LREEIVKFGTSRSRSTCLITSTYWTTGGTGSGTPIIPRPRLAPTPALSFSSVRSVETHPVKSMPVVSPAPAGRSLLAVLVWLRVAPVGWSSRTTTAAPAGISVSMDQGSQTILSSKQIDQILMDRVSSRPLSSDRSLLAVLVWLRVAPVGWSSRTTTAAPAGLGSVERPCPLW
jgi:hypothetical protein